MILSGKTVQLIERLNSILALEDLMFYIRLFCFSDIAARAAFELIK